MPDPHANFAYSTVATAPSPATSGTSLGVQSGEGARFPAVPFNATVWPAGSSPLSSNAEIVRVTARSSDTLTITRTQESTSARTIVVGDQIAATVTAKTLTDAEQAGIAGFCGDGSDGNATISGTTTLTRDMFYDTLTVQSGGILQPAGYKIFCKTLCEVQSGGTIRRNGNNATGATAGAISAVGTIGAGSAGGNGTTTAGVNGTQIQNSYAGSGGAGGLGPSGAGGSGATAVSFSVNTTPPPRMLPHAAMGYAFAANQVILIPAGQGGGGGGGDGTNAGGGGGGGAGPVVINARVVINNGAIESKGGNGANGNGGNSGGGGGGGGGMVIINTNSFTGTTPVVTGGTGGTKTGTGVNGTAGNAGNTFTNVWS